MKAILFITVFFLAFGILAQEIDENTKLKNTLTTIFKLSAEKKYAEAGKLFVYEGEDQTRNLKSVLDFAKKEDKKTIQRICKKIDAFVKLSDNYEIENITDEVKAGRTTKIIKVNFISGDQVLGTNFHFVSLNEKYLLIDLK
ncbi:MAG: hypothetical protein K9J12_16730 [Melioribacteraceae bacterium]|nr:hypothetical protein [Melioribacteraceae bacterium]MCF8263593.1 hypothetical protein [Melioribacteraceae bacterium]MCF8412414.1 hypothetical protein [Melioribacteraceae bacterium]MCF8432186.1 hypothetical protein [Melioribacteraceae bacterium]